MHEKNKRGFRILNVERIGGIKGLTDKPLITLITLILERFTTKDTKSTKKNNFSF